MGETQAQRRGKLAELATVLCLALCLCCTSVSATASLEANVQGLLDASCLACHSNTVLSSLNLATTGFDLDDPATYRVWERVFDRVQRGEMPPPPMPAPDAHVVHQALGALAQALAAANRKARGGQRTPLRRLTRLEYQHTITDLLGIDPAQAAALVQALPAEADAAGLDTVAADQGISALHVRSYLAAAAGALDLALDLAPPPAAQTFKVDYAKSQYLGYMHEGEFLGGGVTKLLDDAVATFFDAVSTYMFHTATEGYEVPHPGRYRITVDAYPYQATTPVTLTLFKGVKGAVATAALTDLIGSFDLLGEAGRTVETSAFLRPGDVVSPSVADLVPPDGPFVNYYAPDKNVKHYTGEGIAMRSLSVEGPLAEPWPPASAQLLLPGVEFADGAVRLNKAPQEHVREVVAAFATRAFRRPLGDEEVRVYVALAEPALAAERPFLDVVRVPLLAILTSPSFLYQSGPPGELDDYALATRLSYLLWRSMPDAALFDAAATGRLSEPTLLAEQVDRLLDDPKSERFIDDFAGQAFRLYELHATTPDAALYPEYDERLGQAMAAETELFLAELIAENLSAGNLIDADFTFLNRRLAEHYGIDGVDGQHMRKVALPDDSKRGGLITQASILKLTANGTVTSPVPRGNFVLANLLGQPAPPPPPNIAGLEPDTRGTTTIREQLAAHRSNTVCASCHTTIDPPGLALEAYDPIGGFRTRYRASGEEIVVDGETYPGKYRRGLPVDASGVTPEGVAFADFEQYRHFLLEHKREQVAWHLVSQFLVLATGAKIEFADRAAVDRIVRVLAAEDYALRSMIHEVAQSGLFRTQ